MKTIFLFSLFEKILYCHLAFSVIWISDISGYFPGLGQGFVSRNKNNLILNCWESEKKNLSPSVTAELITKWGDECGQIHLDVLYECKR